MNIHLPRRRPGILIEVIAWSSLPLITILGIIFLNWNSIWGNDHRPLAVLLLALTIIYPLLAIVIFFWRIHGPLDKLIAASRAVANGDFGQQVVVRTGDEFEELADQFNAMSSSLRDSYTALQQRQERLDLILNGNNDGIFDWDLRANEIYVSPRWKAMFGYSDEDLAEPLKLWSSIVHPADAQRVANEILSQEAAPFYRLECRIRHKDNTYRWILVRGVALHDENGKPFRVAGSHTDITEHKHAQEALRQAYQTLEQRVDERTHEIERRQRVAEGLRDVLNILNSDRPLPEIMDYIVTQALHLLGCDAIALYRLDRQTNMLHIQASSGLEAKYVSGMAIPYGAAAVGMAARTKKPFTVPDTVAALPAWNAQAPAEQRALLPGLVERYHALMAVPLLVKEEVYGAIALYYTVGHEFSDEDVALAVSIADQAALAIESARLRETAEHNAVLAERSRLARDLHDAVTQSLYSVTLYAEAAARLLVAGQHVQAAEHLRELRETAQEALREMRLLIFELRPLILEQSGLAGALRARLEAVEARGGIQTELQIEGVQNLNCLPLSVQEELYHIAQETLNNILKHAGAQHVSVQLKSDAAATYLEISDDGRGFDPEASLAGGGLGLDGMLERAAGIGAKLVIESAPGKGSRVKIRVPLPSTVQAVPESADR